MKTPVADLRTRGGRGTQERRALRALRESYVADHPEQSDDVIATEFFFLGWYSPKTAWTDALRMIRRTRERVSRDAS